MLSYKRTIYKSTFEVRESVEIYHDHFSPDVKATRLSARRHCEIIDGRTRSRFEVQRSLIR